MHVRVDADVVAAAMREDQHQVRRLAPHAGQRQQLLHRRRHAAAEASTICSAGLVHVHGLVAIEADGVDQLLDLARRSAWPSSRRARDANRRARPRRHRIARLRRQHRRDQDLERILLLLFGDLLDRRLLEPVDRLRERRITAAMRRAGRGLRRQAAGIAASTGVSAGWPSSTASTFATARSGHRRPRLARGAAEMRREHDVLELEQPGEHVGSRS